MESPERARERGGMAGCREMKEGGAGVEINREKQVKWGGQRERERERGQM